MFAIAIHGGSKNLTPELEKSYQEGLQQALNSGLSILQQEGSALAAVEAAVVSLEDNVLFNAGKGSAFTSDGIHEMEAAIMDGKSINAGAVSGLNRIKNPVILARTILEKSLHQACEFVILNKIKNMGGEGGVIAIDKKGNLEMIYNSKGMYRGYRLQDQEPRTFIY